MIDSCWKGWEKILEDLKGSSKGLAKRNEKEKYNKAVQDSMHRL